MKKTEQKSSDQKILEASANLEIAKMFNAIEKMHEKWKIFDSYNFNFDTLTKNISDLAEFVDAFAKFRKSDKCMGKEVKMVTDMVEWIKSKARYESQISDLQERLKRAVTAYSTVVDQNKYLRNRFTNFLDKFMDKDFMADEWFNSDIKRWFQSEVRPLDEIIERAMESYYAKKEQECKTNEHPF